MAELTISPDDIRGALQKFVTEYKPDAASTEEVGIVAEAGDGIARVEGLPSAMANELLEFEDGTQQDLVWWRDLMEPYWEEWDSIGIDADARSGRFLQIDEHDGHWVFTQWLVDPEGTNEWSLSARVDLRASDEAGEPVVALVRLGRG